MERRAAAVLVLAALTAPATAALTALAAPQDARVDLVVAATTDVHGRLRGWDYYADTAEGARGLTRIATILDSLRGAHPGRVILVDAGDLLQGNPLTYAAARLDTTGPHAVIAAMNLMRYDAATIGNHEFNYGLRTLDRALGAARFPFLAANARRTRGAAPWRPFTIVERAGVRVGIVGVTSPGSMVWDREHLAGEVTIGDIVPAIRGAVGAARAAGADVIVVVAHAGLSGPSSYDTVDTKFGGENPMARVAREVPGLDLIVYGHSHREVADTVINGVLLTQPRNWATSVSVTHLALERRGAAWLAVAKRARVVLAAGHAEQPELVTAVERAHAAARRYARTVVGSTAVAWRADSARVADTPLMDFVAEVMRRVSGADLASVAAFSLDVRIPAGPVTVAQLAQLYPYDNTLRALRLTGAQLKAYLEQSARYFRVTGTGETATAAPDPSIPGFNYEMVTGADYTIDLTRPAGDRVVGLSVRGTPVRDTARFTIALSNYRAGGAGGYAMVSSAPVTHDKQLEIRQLLIEEITRRRALRPEDFFTPNWRLVPEGLGAAAYRAMTRAGDFERVRAPAGAEPPTSPRADSLRAAFVAPRSSTIRIISTNDFHGALEARPDGNAGLRGGAAYVAAMIRRAEAECSASCASLLVDGGDLFQGTPASNLAFGRPVVDYYNALGYAAAALGNHEFDWGQDTLRARLGEMRFALLAANVTMADGRPVPWLRADTIVTRGGARIGIIGLTTVSTPRTTMPRHVAALRFLDAAPVVDVQARSLRARGAELVIVIGHVGASCTAASCGGELITMARRLTEPVDAIIGGHTHTMTNTEVNGIPVVQGRSSGRAITVTDVPVDRAARGSPGAVRHEVREVRTDSITPDPSIDSLVKRATASVAALVARPFASVDQDFRRSGRQHALGNLIADAQREAAGADVAVMNNGGIRADLRAGAATYGALYEVQPFANLLVRMTVSGQGLRDYFEAMVARPAPGAHVSGVVVRYDTTRAAGSRITDIRVGGAPLEDGRSYTVAMSDFMAAGGDGLALREAVQREELLGIVDLDALIAWVRRMPGGVVRADRAPRLIVEPR